MFQRFRCEERTARYFDHFACGDGQYTSTAYMPDIDAHCRNKRDIEFSRMMLHIPRLHKQILTVDKHFIVHSTPTEVLVK